MPANDGALSVTKWKTLSKGIEKELLLAQGGKPGEDGIAEIKGRLQVLFRRLKRFHYIWQLGSHFSNAFQNRFHRRK